MDPSSPEGLRRASHGPSDWLALDQIAGALNLSRRSVQRRLDDVPGDLKRSEHNGRGRPSILYHRTAIPELREVRSQKSEISPSTLLRTSVQKSEPLTSGNLLNAADLATGQLRAEAVMMYEDLKPRLGESAAAEAICAAYAKQPKTREVVIDERLHDNHIRQSKRMIILGGFSTGTLRLWARKYREGGRTPLALTPELRGKVGRKPKKTEAIPEKLIDRLLAWSIKNPRATLVHALTATRKEWPGDFPDLSYSSWLRILRKRDTSGALATLGKQGISSFRAKHSPVIERDYSEMTYNELWEIDDVTLDFYGYNWNFTQLIRPYAYAIIRVATREWIAVVTTETPIVQDQVRSLIGLAMALPNGGIPDAIRFERGAVACDEYLHDMLTTLGVKVHTTSMDGGKTHKGAFADRAKGHFQGKGVIERALREFHGLLWDNLLQVGTNERESAPANMETMKREIIALAKDGKVIPKLSPVQWMAATFAALEEYNDKPHGGLPEIVDGDKSNSETGQIKYRRMTPHECARAKTANGGSLRVMDERLLPLFLQRGYKVPVTKNGFTLNKFSYGRFDEDIQALSGSSALVYAMPDFPRLAYVQELGRCVEAWKAPKAGAEGEFIETKRGIEAKARNKYTALMERVLEAGSAAVIDQTRILASAVSFEKIEKVNPPALAERMQSMTHQREFHRAKSKELDDRLSFPRSVTPSPRNADTPILNSERRGLTAALADATEELEVLQDLK
jgi:hypothetical protein